MKVSVFCLLLIATLFFSCSDDSGVSGEWLVPQDLVFDGGVGRDGIPAIDVPQFSTVSEIDYLADNDLILGIRSGDEIKAYPHPVLDWHEIVNDEIGNTKFALTYCPLTGTGIGWDRVINGSETTFGVSGLLFNTNLMPYDRSTSSTWSQQQLRCVNGSNIGQEATLYSFIETTWASWKEAYPESQVLNTNTGIDRSYGNYPYSDYRTNDATLLFPISTTDDRLPAKQRVLGVFVDGMPKIYPFNSDTLAIQIDTTNTDSIIIDEGLSPFQLNLDRDQHMGQDILVASSNELNLIVAFKVPNNATFTLLDNQSYPYIFSDQNRTRYDIFGFADTGLENNLPLADQFVGYWFSWGTFYPDVELFSPE